MKFFGSLGSNLREALEAKLAGLVTTGSPLNIGDTERLVDCDGELRVLRSEHNARSERITTFDLCLPKFEVDIPDEVLSDIKTMLVVKVGDDRVSKKKTMIQSNARCCTTPLTVELPASQNGGLCY